MSVISLYTTNPEVEETLMAALVRLNQLEPEPVLAETFSSFSAFLESGKRNPRRILMLAQKGASSVELAAAAAEECPKNPLIWLSDLDFALFSYRLEVDHFALLPGTEEILRTALSNCVKKLRRNHPPPFVQESPKKVESFPSKLMAKLTGFFRIKK